MVVWWPPNFGEAETLVDGGQRRTASRKPFLGGLWLIFCSNNTDDESTSTSSSGIYVQRLHNVAKQNILFIFMTNQFCCSRKIHTTKGSLLIYCKKSEDVTISHTPGSPVACHR